VTDRSSVGHGLFVVSRVLFGGVLGFMGLNGFTANDEQVAYAQSQDVPNAEFLVPLSHGMLAFGGASIALWRWPVVGAGAIATFLVGVTSQMHDFWNIEDDQQQEEMITFLKNTALFGAAIAFLVRASEQEKR
jgi:putative oxidoreductase